MDYIYRVGWLVSFIIFSQNAGGAPHMKQIPFRVTFTLQADELQKEYTEVFWAKSARTARAVALAGAGPNRIFIHSVEEVIS